jgi:flagellar biogenesis protein FliO
MGWAFWAGYLGKLAIAAAVLAALYAVARVLRGEHPLSRGARCVRLLATTPLSPHAALHLVRVGTRHFLLGSGGGAVSSLAELEPGDVEVVIR